MKSNVFSTIFGISSFLIAACSSDSGSGADSINTLNPTNPSTSTCALANKYLPAYSAIAYEDIFGGGCQATAHISIAQATEYSNLLVANDFEQIQIAPATFSYKKNISIDSAVTLVLTHQSETLTASLQEEIRTYEWGDLSVVADNFLYDGICADKWLHIDDKTIRCTPNGDLDFIKLNDLGWKNNGNVLGTYQYKDKIYTIVIKVDKYLYLSSDK
ncbi:hypothetical protein [Fibrobacter sp.]|uniref:hypothetical protein n=1 Tax=Fibrobacter sp. TaxID=35828 RepID=UPI002624AAE2|nr:hypothetical protein [Fibrobacter sp.]MDD5943501.1 hypothetical protein [Fibrobacter sp.]